MRFLVLDQGLLARECADEIAARGHDVFLADPKDFLFASEIERADAIFSVNVHAPLAEAAKRRHVPYLAWIVDPLVNRAKLEPERKAASGHCRIFSYDRSQVDLYRLLGFPHAEYLPAGAASAFCEDPDGKAGGPNLSIGFVGAPLIEKTNEFAAYRRQLEAAVQGGKDPKGYFRKFLSIADRCVEEQRGDLVNFRIPDRFLELEREEGIEVMSKDWSPEKWQVVLAMSKEAAREHRLGVCQALAGLGIHVWGPQEWTRALLPGMSYGGPAPYPEGALDVYRRSAVNLNVTRIYAGDVVANRVWDVLAAGGFLLTDYRPELERHFEIGRDLACYRTVAEARSLAEHYLAHPEERRRIAASGRAKVLGAHTLGHRVDRVLFS